MTYKCTLWPASINASTRFFEKTISASQPPLPTDFDASSPTTKLCGAGPHELRLWRNKLGNFAEAQHSATVHADAAQGLAGVGVVGKVPGAQLFESNEAQVGLAVQHSAGSHGFPAHSSVGLGTIGEKPAPHAAASNVAPGVAQVGLAQLIATSLAK